VGNCLQENLKNNKGKHIDKRRGKTIRHQGQTNHKDKLSNLYTAYASGSVAAQVSPCYTTIGCPGSPTGMLQPHGNNPLCYIGTSPKLQRSFLSSFLLSLSQLKHLAPQKWNNLIIIKKQK